DRRAAVATGVSLGCDTALRAAGVRIDATGLDILHATRPAVVIANHQSALDPLVMATLLRADFTIVAKREARWDPRAALATVLLDPVFIDRSNSAASRAALAEVTERIRAGLSLLIFPEGTRAPTPVLRPFRKGAFNLALAARVPIVPVVLRNTGEILPRHGRTIRPGVVDIRVLDPVVIPDADAIDAVVSTLHRRYAQTLAAWPQKESPHA
ncbi:MAG: lysophospholipid acyltransferase family protein, partial [Candidatus Phosphoribacter sp.]